MIIIGTSLLKLYFGIKVLYILLESITQFSERVTSFTHLRTLKDRLPGTCIFDPDPRCKRGVAGRRDIIEIYFGISRLKRNNKLLLAHANKENWFGFFVVDSGFFC